MYNIKQDVIKGKTTNVTVLQLMKVQFMILEKI